MRVSEQEATEREGVRRVRDAFEGIGWGPVPNAEHDLGTDLLVMARDDRRFDRALIVGAQVKAGPHYFKDGKRAKRGPVPGWWYYESDARHFDDWVVHSLPHLLVLHNLEDGKSYWAHVTAKNVASTGKGCKILVPEHQTIDSDHADDLFKVACTQRSAPALEGTAFEGLADGIPPGRPLRYALIAPRLVAPHPNARQDDPISPVQGAALLAQGRFPDLVRFSDAHQSVPDPRQPYTGREWGWRFVAAFWDLASTDSVDLLEAAHASARKPEESAASGVLLACALHREGNCGRALEVLDGLVEGDELAAADHGWVLVQRARLRTETGDFEGCRADAAAAQRHFRGDADDVTVSALAAAAAWQLYAAAFLADKPDWETWDKEFNRLVGAADTAVSWWRSQTESWGLGDALERRFEAWADPFPRHLVPMGGPEDPAPVRSRVQRRHHRRAQPLEARLRPIRAAAAHGRRQLRRRGARASRTGRGARSAAPKRRQQVAGKSDPPPPLRRPDRAVSRNGEQDPAHRMDPYHRRSQLRRARRRRRPRRRGGGHRAGMLVRRTGGASRRAQRESETEPPDSDGRPRSRHRPAARRRTTGPHRRGPHARRPARSAAADDHPASMRSHQLPRLRQSRRCGQTSALGEDVGAAGVDSGKLAHLAGRRRPHRSRGSEAAGRAAAGDLQALGAVSDLASLDPGQVAAIVGHLAEAAEQNLADARGGTHGGDRIDAAWWLIRIGFEFPDLTRWDKALELLSDPSVAGHDKRDACLLAANNCGDLPDDVRSALAAGAAAIATAQAGVGFDADMAAIETVVLRIGLGDMAGGEAAAAMAKLAAGTPEQRRDAAIVLGWGRTADQQPMLAVLSGDPHPAVRNYAALAIGRLAAQDPTPQMSVLAWEAARDSGALIPATLLTGLAAGEGAAPEIAADIAQHLQQHPSAIVRNRAHEESSDSPPPQHRTASSEQPPQMRRGPGGTAAGADSSRPAEKVREGQPHGFSAACRFA